MEKFYLGLALIDVFMLAIIVLFGMFY